MNPITSPEAKRLEVCPVCNTNVEARGLYANFKSKDNYGLAYRFCSWSHFNEFKDAHTLEVI